MLRPMPNLLKIWRWPLHSQVLLGLLVGALLGAWLGAWGVAQVPPGAPAATAGALAAEAVQATWPFVLLRLVGDLFINGLKLIIVPIVTSSIILAVVNIGSGSGFGRLASKTLAYYFATSLLAILTGLLLINLVHPGVGADGRGILEGQDISAYASEQAENQRRVGGRSALDFLDVFRQMVPPNLVAAAAEGQLLGLIVVALVVGYFLARMHTPGAQAVIYFTQGVYDVALKVTDLVLRFAPIGVIGLLAVTVGEQYARLVPDARFADFLTGIVQFALTALAALAIHFLVSLPLIVRFIGGLSPLRQYRAMAPALVTAFSTCSSSATLPVTMDCVETRAGVSNRTASFVLPLGATVNMDGTALYECVAVIFICQAFGVELGFAQQFLIVLVALLTSIGVAGVPAASLVAIIIILEGVQAQLAPGAPSLVAGLGLLFVFDRPLDMCRTSVNVFSDSCGAVVIARTEGETGVLDSTPDTHSPAMFPVPIRSSERKASGGSP